MSLYKVLGATALAGLLIFAVTSFSQATNAADTILEHQVFDKEEENVSVQDDEADDGSVASHIILVSTMDGKITALDVNGNVLWSLNVDDEPLLSGTFSAHQKMFAGELPYTIVPSLDGSLFMLEIKRSLLRPVPLTADISRVINDVAITGGSVNTKTGIDPITGEVKYRCTSGKCEQTVPTTMSSQTLVLTRNTQTARAADPLTGLEKWNLSVSEYMLQLFDQGGSIRKVDANRANNIGLRLKPPIGVVSLYECDNLLWEYRLSSPIARVWQLFAGQLKEVSLFDSNYIETLNNFAAGSQKPNDRLPRFETSFYLGLYNTEPYIIPSEKMRLQRYAYNVQPYGSDRLFNHGNLFLHDLISVDAFKRKFHSTLKEIQTSDYKSKKLPLLENCALDEAVLVPGSSEVDNTEPNNEEIYGGWYINVPLLTAQNLIAESTSSLSNIRGTSDGTCTMRNQLTKRISAEYRKELLHNWWQIGGIITAFIGCLSVMLFTLKAFHSEVVDDARNKVVVDEHQTNAETMTGSSKSSSTITVTTPSNTYVSKFFEDFTPIRCLGRGGYGVVFNCKHKLDDRNYAVKRITVSNTASAIERVTREAKAMAKLNHPGIIRYFHTWIEKPPAEWQQTKDKEILEQLRMIDNLSGSSFLVLSKQRSHVNLNRLSTEDDSLLFKKKNRGIFSEKSFSNIWSERKTKSLDESSGSWMVSENVAVSNSTTSSSESENALSEPKPLSLSKTDENSLSIVFAQESGLVEQGTSSKRISGDSSSSSLSLKPLEPPLVLVANDDDLKSCRTAKDYIYLYIQMELCQELTLHNWLLNNKDEVSHEVSKMRFWFKQLVCAVDYIHEQGLIHRDIKPQNIFFSADCQNTLKIGDLGLATNLETEESSSSVHALSTRRHTGNVGTRLYMSPEQLKGKAYNQKVDVFSLGLIFTEMLIPFQTVMERHEVLTTLQSGTLPPQYLSNLPEERNFIHWLTAEDPACRPSSAEVMHCSYLKENKQMKTD